MKKIYTRVSSIAGNVITIKAENVGYGDLAYIQGANPSLAQVIKILYDEVSLQVFNGTKGISTGDHVEFLGHSLKVPFSENLLGRIFTGGGKPRDNHQCSNHRHYIMFQGGVKETRGIYC